jgi:hypothetical protein
MILRLHDAFGRGPDGVMKPLKRLRVAAVAQRATMTPREPAAAR